MEDSPAEKSGLKAGDVIIDLNDELVEKTSDISKILKDLEAGTEINILVMRDKKRKTVKVSLEEPPEDWGKTPFHELSKENIFFDFDEVGDHHIKIHRKHDKEGSSMFYGKKAQ